MGDNELKPNNFFKRIKEECTCAECGRKIEKPSNPIVSELVFFGRNHETICAGCKRQGADWQQWGAIVA